jgi:lactoylglutathione lyase
MAQTAITDIGTVGIPVSDQDKAAEFFVGTLGFEKRLDVRMGESFRWVTVAAPGASTSVALITRPDTGADTGIRFLVPDAQTEHTAMRQRGKARTLMPFRRRKSSAQFDRGGARIVQ